MSDHATGYESPFNVYDHPHDSDDPLCLARLHHDHPERATWEECFVAACALCGEEGADQFALWAARHVVELGLKLLIDGRSTGHELDKLLDQAQGFDADEESRRMREFVLDLHRIDPKGDASRYGFTKSGDVSLRSVCCVERRQLNDLVADYHWYVERRMGWLPDPDVKARGSPA